MNYRDRDGVVHQALWLSWVDSYSTFNLICFDAKQFEENHVGELRDIYQPLPLTTVVTCLQCLADL